MDNLDSFLAVLRDFKKEPGLSVEEYWAEVNKISAEEQKAFLEEHKKLTLSDDLFHRCFTM
jgi:hypothetical protein